jgi:hypothetical protein
LDKVAVKKCFGKTPRIKNRVCKYLQPAKEIIYKTREKAILFTVLQKSEEETMLAEKDKHFNFGTSIRIKKGTKQPQYHICFSTVVWPGADCIFFR